MCNCRSRSVFVSLYIIEHSYNVVILITILSFPCSRAFRWLSADVLRSEEAYLVNKNMSFRCLLKKGFFKHSFYQGWHRNSIDILTKRNQFMKRIESCLRNQNNADKSKWTSVSGLRHTAVFTVAAAAILQLNDESEKKEEDSELVKSIKLAVFSLQVCISWYTLSGVAAKYYKSYCCTMFCIGPE